MKHGKTKLTFRINDNPEKYTRLIHQYAVIDEMKLFHVKDGIYYMNDSVTGGQSLEYAVYGNELILQAWISGYNRPTPLEGKVNLLLINAFRNKLVTLVNSLQQEGAVYTGEEVVESIALLNPNPTGQVQVIKLNKENISNSSNQDKNQATTFNAAPPVTNPAMQQLQDKEMKRKNILVTAGFVIAILNILLLVLSGNSVLGGLGYIITFYAGSQGLHTPKHKMAIATLIITGISVVIFLFLLIAGIIFG